MVREQREWQGEEQKDGRGLLALEKKTQRRQSCGERRDGKEGSGEAD